MQDAGILKAMSKRRTDESKPKPYAETATSKAAPQPPWAGALPENPAPERTSRIWNAYMAAAAEFERVMGEEVSAERDAELKAQFPATLGLPSVWYELVGGMLAQYRFEAGVVHVLRKDPLAWVLGQLFAAVHHCLRSDAPLEKLTEPLTRDHSVADWAATVLADAGCVPPFASGAQRKIYADRLAEVAEEAVVRHRCLRDRDPEFDVEEEVDGLRDDLLQLAIVPWAVDQAARDYRKWLTNAGHLSLEGAVTSELLLRAWLVPAGFPVVSAVTSFDNLRAVEDQVRDALKQGVDGKRIARAFARAFGEDAKNLFGARAYKKRRRAQRRSKHRGS